MKPFATTAITVALLGFTLGAGVNFLIVRNASQSVATPSLNLGDSKLKSAPDSERYWRDRFLAILEEPSVVRQMAAFYATALETPDDAFPDVLEAIYPEGWARHMGDVPIAFCMEWLRRGGNGMAYWTEAMAARHPELVDNLAGVYANFGYQGDPRTVNVIAVIRTTSLRDSLAAEYLAALERSAPEALFAARYALQGPHQAFRSLQPFEFEAAVATYWDHAQELLSQGVPPPHQVAFELGKRYGSACFDRFDEAIPPETLLGMLAGSEGVSTHLESKLLATANFGYLRPDSLEPRDRQRLLLNIAGNPVLHPLLLNPTLRSVVAQDLDHSIAAQLLAFPNLSPRLRATVLHQSAKRFDPFELLPQVSNLSPFARENVLAAAELPDDPEQLAAWIDTLPEGWLSPRIAKKAVAAALQTHDLSLLDRLASELGDLSEALPDDPASSAALFQQAPAHFLEAVHELPAEEQTRRLAQILQHAPPEELSLVIEALPAQKGPLLAELAASQPESVLDLISRQWPEQLSGRDAARLASNLATGPLAETAFTQLAANEPTDAVRARVLVDFLATRQSFDRVQTDEWIRSAASPQTRYIGGFAQAAAQFGETGEAATLQALYADDPQLFLQLLGHRVSVDHQLRRRSLEIMKLPFLDNRARLSIHQSLYGESPKS